MTTPAFLAPAAQPNTSEDAHDAEHAIQYRGRAAAARPPPPEAAPPEAAPPEAPPRWADLPPEAPPRWADLPPEALGLVLAQLKTVELRCQAACVCRSWRAAAAARPAPWKEVHVGVGSRYGEFGGGAEWATRKFVAQLRWCSALGGATKSPHVFACSASEEDLLGGFHDGEAAGRAQPGALVEALEARGPALRALQIEDANGQLGFYSPPVAAAWAGALRGLPSSHLDLPHFRDAWPLPSQLTALTALTACSPTQPVHSERLYADATLARRAPMRTAAPRRSRPRCASCVPADVRHRRLFGLAPPGRPLRAHRARAPRPPGGRALQRGRRAALGE
jgi:hypothetical protein